MISLTQLSKSGTLYEPRKVSYNKRAWGLKPPTGQICTWRVTCHVRLRCDFFVRSMWVASSNYQHRAYQFLWRTLQIIYVSCFYTYMVSQPIRRFRKPRGMSKLLARLLSWGSTWGANLFPFLLRWLNVGYLVSGFSTK